MILILCIYILDQNVLHVYSSNGERHLTNLQFPVSKVWPTKTGILLEKLASSTVVQNHTIMMPRLFSLTHPLEEMCPVLYKPRNNHVRYLVDSQYQILFSDECCNMLLMYDRRLNEHFIALLRRATEDEIANIGNQNETGYINFSYSPFFSSAVNKHLNMGNNTTNLQSTATGNSYSSFTQNSMKRLNGKKYKQKKTFKSIIELFHY